MPDPRPSILAVVGWAFYVAVSWTWVIGMFLPVLLARDFGLWGWVAFAVPNAVGAAAVGWWWRTPRASAEFVVRHARAVGLFTAVTLALQVFALGWVGGRLDKAGALPALFTALLASALPALAGGRWHRTAAVVAWTLSALIGGYLLYDGWLTLPPADVDDPAGLAGLALACGLGFLLCPHLDVTFHAARQALGERAKLGFGLGFFLLFPAMIALTLGYAGKLPGLMLGGFGDRVNGLAAVLILLHLTIQVTATNRFHAVALARAGAAIGGPRPTWRWAAALAAVALLGYAMSRPIVADRELFGHSPGEVAYRLFLAFYGLGFPAYLLLGGGRRLWATLAVAGPFFAVSFLGGAAGWSMAWAGIGVAIVSVAWLIGRR